MARRLLCLAGERSNKDCDGENRDENGDERDGTHGPCASPDLAPVHEGPQGSVAFPVGQTRTISGRGALREPRPLKREVRRPCDPASHNRGLLYDFIRSQQPRSWDGEP